MGGGALRRAGAAPRHSLHVPSRRDLLAAHDVRSGKTRRVALFSGADGVELFAWEGEGGDRYGAAILGPGDLDGDGSGDVVIGAPGAGYVEVRSGLDGSRLQRLEAPAEGVSFGNGLVGLGDLDGDSHAEFGILDEFEGVDRLHVYSTASWKRSLVLADDGLWISSARTTKDENEDGIRDLLVGARNGARIVSGTDGAVLRTLLVGMPSPLPLPIGDYDGDGTDDLLVRTWDSCDLGWVLELNAYAAVRVVSGRTEKLLFEAWYRYPMPWIHGPVDLDRDGCSDFWVAFDGEFRAYSR